MATCYRHPSRETGVSCSNCGRPICPDCMTTTPVGMRCPECSRQRTAVKRLRDIASVPRVTYALIAINVIVFLTEQGQLSFTEHDDPRQGDRRRHPLPRRDRRRPPVLPARHRGLPAREPPAHRLQHVPALHARADARARDRRARFAAIYFTALLAGSFGALLATPGADARRLGRDLRPDGRRRGRAARTWLQRHAVRYRRADHLQPDPQLHARRDLRRRPHRRADRRRARGARDPHRGRAANCRRSASSACLALSAIAVAASIAVSNVERQRLRLSAALSRAASPAGPSSTARPSIDDAHRSSSGCSSRASSSRPSTSRGPGREK